MLTPFDLPEGATWREITDEDRSWLANTYKHDPEKCAAFTVNITIRHPDGRERVYVDDGFPFIATEESLMEALHGVEYGWSDGNYGCDCNRSAFFARAGAEDDALDVPCGATYRVVAPAWLADEAPTS